MQNGPDFDVDMELIADSFRVVSDPGAWDKLIETWNRKIASAGFGEACISHESQLRRHYSSIEGLLDKVGLPLAQDPIEAAVAAVQEPAMAVTDKLRVIAINGAGRGAFRLEQGQIAHLDWLCQTQWSAFREIAMPNSARKNLRFRIIRTRWSDGRDGYAEVFPITAPNINEPLTVVRELTIHWSKSIDNVLAEAFNLTHAETEICRLLFTHVDMNKVADLRGVSVRTARLQLSHIFAKTDTQSQIELVRFLVLLATRLSTRKGNAPLQWSDPLGRERILRRPDGRRLAYSWLGDPNGKPALFVHGIVNGYLYPEEFEATLKDRGIKLLVLTRPGCGNTDRDAAADSFTDHVETISYFCNELGLKGIAGSAIHAGVIPLTAVAAKADSPFCAIVGMGRFISYSPKRFAKIAMLPRTLLWLSLNAPWAAYTVGKHAYRALIQQGVDWYITRAYRDMPFDCATTKRAEIATLIRNACAFTFLQGPDVFFDDMRLRGTDIGQSLRNLSVPFHWLLGGVDVYGADTSEGLFYEPEDFETMAALNPLVTIEQAAEASELLPYQRPELVATRIADAADGVAFPNAWNNQHTAGH